MHLFFPFVLFPNWADTGWPPVSHHLAPKTLTSRHISLYPCWTQISLPISSLFLENHTVRAKCGNCPKHTEVNEVSQRDGKRLEVGTNQPRRLYAGSQTDAVTEWAPAVPILGSKPGYSLIFLDLALQWTFRWAIMTEKLPSTSTHGLKEAGMWSATQSS